MTIQMVKKGGETIIVISGPETERDELAYRIAKAYLAPKSEAAQMLADTPDAPESGSVERMETKAIAGTPNPEVPPTAQAIADSVPYEALRNPKEFVIPDGTYAGKRIAEALAEGQEDALVALYRLASGMPDSADRRQISEHCRSYMAEMPNNLERLKTKEQKCNYLQKLGEIVRLPQLLQTLGYQSMTDFARNATEEEVNRAVSIMAYSLARKVKK